MGCIAIPAEMQATTDRGGQPHFAAGAVDVQHQLAAIFKGDGQRVRIVVQFKQTLAVLGFELPEDGLQAVGGTREKLSIDHHDFHAAGGAAPLDGLVLGKAALHCAQLLLLRQRVCSAPIPLRTFDCVLRMSDSRKPAGTPRRKSEPKLFGDAPRASEGPSPRRNAQPRASDGEGRKVVYHKKSTGSGPKKRKSGGGGRGGSGGGRFSAFRAWLWGHLTTGKLWARVLSLGFTLAIIGIIILIPFFLMLPDISKLGQADKKPSIIVVSVSGEPIGQFGDVMGPEVPFDQIPRTMVDALLSTEDRRFFEHFGVDPWGIVRAVVANARAGHVVQGGSTLTQQLAKNLFLTPDRNMRRKMDEALLALKLEAHFSKKEIMQIYLNRVYLGGGNFGIEAAAERYFGKPAPQLNTAESAVLVGMLKAPSRYSPLNNPDLARKRGEQVLFNMKDAGFLNEKALTSAKQQMKSVFAAHKNAWVRAPYFADWIADELSDYIGGLNQDVVVTTTLDTRLQKLADDALNKVMHESGGEMHASQGALVSMTPDGAVRAMVGGLDYGQSQFNRATQALRQPGSSFKLFVYLAGIENGYLPESVMTDQPLYIKVPGRTWSPQNNEGKFRGPVSLKEAFADSINTIAVQISEAIGRDKVAMMARRLGVKIQGPVTPSIALGATEATLFDMTKAYAHLASGGKSVMPYGILKIELAHPSAEQERLLYERQGSGFGQALSFSTVSKMNILTKAVMGAGGTGGAANIGRPVAGKTGTTSDFRDAWFIGYVPQLVTGVWVGNDDNSSMKKSYGGKLPARIFAEYMKPAVADLPVEEIPTYSGSTFDGLLPWQQAPAPAENAAPADETTGAMPMGAQPMGQAAPSAPLEEPQEAPREESQQEEKLGDNFWNKLRGSVPSKDELEYEYPKRNR